MSCREVQASGEPHMRWWTTETSGSNHNPDEKSTLYSFPPKHLIEQSCMSTNEDNQNKVRQRYMYALLPPPKTQTESVRSTALSTILHTSTIYTHEHIPDLPLVLKRTRTDTCIPQWKLVLKPDDKHIISIAERNKSCADGQKRGNLTPTVKPHFNFMEAGM